MYIMQLPALSLMLCVVSALSLPEPLLRRGSSVSRIIATCDLTKAKMPEAPTPLDPPEKGSMLTHVLVGRGTQNYTCADSTHESSPVANGAVAALFNMTCMTAPFPQLVSNMPAIALKYPVPSDSTAFNAFHSGKHWFPDSKTPQFDLVTKEHDLGTIRCSKDSQSNAPNPSADVPWLKLKVKAANSCTITEVYRVDTAGGMPPKTCQGQPSSFVIQYAAAYWFFSNPDAKPPGY